MKPFLGRVKRYVDKRILNRSKYRIGRRWFDDNGDVVHRLSYDLNSHSTVWDVGGFQGQWAQEIHSIYGSQVSVFEAHPTYIDYLKKRFDEHQAINIYPFGLGAFSRRDTISDDDDSSSISNQVSRQTLDVDIRDVIDVMREISPGGIDLLKLNIEGAEYEVLNRLLEEDKFRDIRCLQIQFHDFFKNATQLRQEIQKGLVRSHRQTFNYSFVWEGWERRV